MSQKVSGEEKAAEPEPEGERKGESTPVAPEEAVDEKGKCWLKF